MIKEIHKFKINKDIFSLVKFSSQDENILDFFDIQSSNDINNFVNIFFIQKNKIINYQRFRFDFLCKEEDNFNNISFKIKKTDIIDIEIDISVKKNNQYILVAKDICVEDFSNFEDSFYIVLKNLPQTIFAKTKKS